VVTPSSGTTDAQGQASTSWTLPSTAGSHSVTASANGASVQLTATAVADVADSMFAARGRDQSGTVDVALGDSIVVGVVDQYENPVAGHTVTFAAGSGSVSPTSAITDAAGEAGAEWTLGSAPGTQSASATAGGLKGEPVAFVATAATLGILAIAPDTIVEGVTVTITGTGFSTTPSNNDVTVDGTAATVVTATATTLTVTVPNFDCLPARDVDVAVSTGGVSATLSHPLRSGSGLNLAVGEITWTTDPADFCLQFDPSSTGGDEYVFGVGVAAETPTLFQVVSVTGVQGAVPPGPAGVPGRGTPAPAGVGLAAADLEASAGRYAAEQRVRTLEEQLFARATPQLSQSAAAVSAGAMAVPNEGDTLRLRVPNVDNLGGSGNTTGACDSIPIDVVVRKVGGAGIFVTDLNNPATDSLTDAEIAAYSDTFDVNIFAVDTAYFGSPTDLDANERVFVVLTIEVNKLLSGQIAGFVFSGDLFDPASCATSDQGEIFYGHVPDPNNVAGTIARSKAAVLFQMPSLIAHEFTHNIQQSRRLELNGVNLSRWEAEGQAVLAEEVVGHSILGNTAGMDYGSATALTGGGISWYRAAFQRLANYYGWTGAGRAPDAPEDCTLFGTAELNSTTACLAFYFYGASWSFQRYVIDRFGAGFAGGPEGLTRAWIGANPQMSGVENVEALLNVQFDSLFVRWAAMHYVDGRVPSADPSLLMSSWDIHDIMTGLGATAPLLPAARTFGDFSASESIRAGSTAYSSLSVGATRPALAVRVRSPTDQVLGTTLKPQLWIVRVQ
jgi:hypothetical protein